MNSNVRRELKALINSIQATQQQLREHSEGLESIKDEQEDILYNIPDNLQSSERYERQEQATESLDQAVDHLQDSIESINTAIESINEAINA